MRPDVISYSSVLSACATQGQWRWALEVYGRMKGETLEMWLDVISCNAAGPRIGFFGDAAGHPNKSVEVLMSVDECKKHVSENWVLAVGKLVAS